MPAGLVGSAAKFRLVVVGCQGIGDDEQIGLDEEYSSRVRGDAIFFFTVAFVVHARDVIESSVRLPIHIERRPRNVSFAIAAPAARGLAVHLERLPCIRSAAALRLPIY